MIDAAYAVLQQQNINSSREQLINCTYTNTIYGNVGCDGGDQGMALSYAVQTGVSSETLYPYTYVNTPVGSGPVSRHDF